MQELIVISGKGGTGKTSVVASLAALADHAVLVDCDVEAPDLHLLLAPELQSSEDFVGGRTAYLRWSECIGCGRCAELCRFGAIQPLGPGNRFAEHTYVVHPLACEGCNLCAEICPARAIEMVPSVCGQWFRSQTRHGPLIHARLRPGRGNSGKLVTLLRKEARALAAENGHTLIIGDGVPGVGCPVIASVGGATLVLIVVEPSVSGLHDFERAADLTAHFSVPTVICVNKHDVAPALTERIEATARARGLDLVGQIPYDDSVVAAQMQARSLIEHSDGPASQAVRTLWNNLQCRLAALRGEQQPATPGANGQKECP